MANFRPQCGAAAGGAFCAKCGTPLGGAPQASAPAPAPPPAAVPVQAVQPAPAAKSNSIVLKLILVLIGLFFVMGIAGVMGVWYIGSKVKAKAREIGREYGIDTSAERSRRGAGSASGSNRDGCSLLSPEEVSSLVGYKGVRTEKGAGASPPHFPPPPPLHNIQDALTPHATHSRK